MFPVTSQFEMAGNPKENQIAGAIHDRIDHVWPIISKRVRNIPEYSELFVSAFDHIENAADVTMVEIAEALSAFINAEWRSYDAPFDEYIAGNSNALTPPQKRGLDLFYNKANCASCHSGQLFTDHDFHALALPPFGPGRTRRFDPFTRDVGRMGETDLLEDAYRFRTPSIRNVTLTAPYGHNGAYATLEGIIRHHLTPLESLQQWDPKQANLPDVPWVSQIDYLVHDDKREMARIKAHVDIKPVALEDDEIDDLLDFLTALEGKTAHKLPFGRPYKVPSKLPVD
jgi:cytochrome c peroxidase